jgi:hypothetical protein
MLANAANLRRAGLLLRAMAKRAAFQAGRFIDARQVARECALLATDRELADIEGYLVYQGWVLSEEPESRRDGFYALTRHGMDESWRAPPAEPKPPRPKEAY